MKISAAVSLLFCASLMLGETITTSAACGDGASLQPGASCMTGSFGNAYSNASGSTSLSVSDNIVSLTTVGNTVANGVPMAPIQLAAIQTDVTAGIEAQGSGNGFAVITFAPQAQTGGEGSASVSFSFQGLSVQCYQIPNSCQGGVRTLPIQLGNVLAFVFTAESMAVANSTEHSDSRDMASISISFFGADGITPVAVVDPVIPPVPEPTGLALIGLGLVALACWRKADKA